MENITDVAGILVFDKWTGNTDGRQTIAVQSANPGYFKAIMIDQGFCFNGENWDFKDFPRHSTNLYNAVWKWIPSFSMFEIWFDRLNHVIDAALLETLANKIPPEWYNNDREALQRLLQLLDSRRNQVAGLVLAAWKKYERIAHLPVIGSPSLDLTMLDETGTETLTWRKCRRQSHPSFISESVVRRSAYLYRYTTARDCANIMCFITFACFWVLRFFDRHHNQ